MLLAPAASLFDHSIRSSAYALCLYSKNLLRLWQAACTSGRRRSAQRNQEQCVEVKICYKAIECLSWQRFPSSSACVPNAVQDLIRELLPSPQRCLEEIHALLPQLAAQRYQELVEEVSH